VRDLAAGTDGSLWFWAATKKQARVYRWSAGQAQSSLLGTDVLDTGPQGDPVLVTDSNNDAWLGINTTLIHAAGAGAVSSVTLPAISDNIGVEAYRPPEIKGLHVIAGLGTWKNDIGIVTSASTNAFIYDITTAHFTELLLPDGYEALSTAFLADGTMVIGLRSLSTGRPDTVAFYGTPTAASPAAPVLQSIADSSTARAVSSGVVMGNELPSIVTSPSGAPELLAASSTDRLDSELGGAVELSPGQFIVGTQTGVSLIDSSSGATAQRATYPAVDCLPATPEGATPTSSCPEVPVAIATMSGKAFALVRVPTGTSLVQLNLQ
jgi:hypothetical protein